MRTKLASKRSESEGFIGTEVRRSDGDRTCLSPVT